MMNHLIWLLPLIPLLMAFIAHEGLSRFQMETVFVAEEKALLYHLG